MEAGVRPEKRREQHAQLRGGDAQLVFQHRRGNRKVAAIDVIDEHGYGEQDDDNQKWTGDARALGWPGSGHEESATSSPASLGFATWIGGIGRRRRAPRLGNPRGVGVAREEFSRLGAGDA